MGHDLPRVRMWGNFPTHSLSRPGLDPVTLDAYDVYIVKDHGVELKAKAPPLIDYAMFWDLKIATDGISGHAAHIKFPHHVNMHL